MNVLIGLAIALALSILGNILLWSSRDEAIQETAQVQSALKQSRDVAQTCSDSVQALKDKADAAEAIAALAREANNKAADEKTIKGTRTLQVQPSTPGNECKSTTDLLRSWHSQRAVK